MTTFTLQDLTPAQQEAVKQHEAMHAAYQVVNTRSINDLPTTPEEDEAMDTLAKLGGGVALKEMFAGMGQDLTAQHAPAPQPTLADIVNSICTQLQLLTTVLSQSQAETKAGENSLQECVSTTLQQADWFKDLIRVELVALDLEKIAESAVESIVENEVESYFENRFDPSDHFDFGDAVSDCVSDQIDDVVSDKIDDAVDAYLSNATISISK
jgi:hypothetical protein